MFNQEDEKFIINVMSGRVPTITPMERAKFGVIYKDILNSGYYIGMKKGGEIVISNKNPEKNERQKADYDNFMKNMFVRA